MSAHQRTTIAHALRSQLQARIPLLASKTFLERTTPLTKHEPTAIVVTTGEDRTDETSFGTGWPREYTRFFQITIDTSARHQEASSALDLANAVAYDVEAAVAFDPTLGGVCRDLRLNQSVPEVLDDGGIYVGVIAIEYEAVYVTTEETDGALVWFNRFGVEYDLAAAQADAETANDLVEIREGATGPA